jgi:predicted phage terminase large subunit-like protein
MTITAATSLFTPERIERAKARTVELCNLTLSQYIRQAWHILEPTTPYTHGWHIDAISDHLEAVSRGEIRNLVINMPPRHMKSLSVSVFWPTWVWTREPSKRWLFSSYAQELAIRDSLKSRRLIQSKWYQERWAAIYQLTSDQNVKSRFENNRTGYRLATSVGGGATGEGGDIVVVDDPHQIDQVESDVVREGVLTWWDETMSTRLNDADTGSRVIVMQRLHESDLSGHVLAKGNYEHLTLPAEYEPATYVTGIGWSDPRTEDGELLWPQKFSRQALSDLKLALGSYGVAGQLQQRPAPRGGGMFKRPWFEIVADYPRDFTFVRYWDKAATEAGKGSTSYTAGVLGAVDRNRIFYILDVVRGQWSAGERDRIIKQTAILDAHTYGLDNPAAVKIWGEQEPGSGGKESADSFIKLLAGYPAYKDKVTGSKEVRANPLASYAEAGNVKLLQAEWNSGYLDRMCFFPMGTYKDETDATSGAFNHLLHLGAPVLAETMEEISKAEPGRFNRGENESRWHNR